MTEPERQLHIAIVGAGIVGVSAAIWALRDGHKVTLIDREGPATGTSFGNGGVLASCSMVPVTGPGLMAKAPRMALDRNQPLFLKWGYLPRLAPWLMRYMSHANEADTRRIGAAIGGIVGDSLAEHRALAEGTGAEHWIKPSNYSYLYKDRSVYASEALSWEIRRAQGIHIEEMTGPDFRAYDPIFGDEVGFAIRMSDHGRIKDPARYVQDLAAYAGTLGAKILKAKVRDIAQDAGRAIGVQLDGDMLAADRVIVASGIWSGPLAKGLGLSVPMESERGYHVELWNPSVMPRDPVMVASGKFVATPMEGRLRLAGVVEFGGLGAEPARAPLALLRKRAAQVMPGLTCEKETEWMGHRPAPADSIPVIGEVPWVKGAYLGFGHHHIGLTGGPKTGRLLAQIISGRTPNLDMSVYAPSRFKT